jgi:hypothetical protein
MIEDTLTTRVYPAYQFQEGGFAFQVRINGALGTFGWCQTEAMAQTLAQKAAAEFTEESESFSSCEPDCLGDHSRDSSCILEEGDQ